MNGRGRWFRDGEWPIWGWDSSSSEWHRLERACGLTGASLVAMAIAAEVLAVHRGCPRAEAWDRLAFRLESWAGGRR